MYYLSLLLLTFIPFVLSSSSDESEEWIKLLNLPKEENTIQATVCQLNGQTIQQYLVDNPSQSLVLIIKSTSGAQPTELAQKSAQLLANRNVNVCELSVSDKTVSPFGTDGSILIFSNGKQYQYYGRRTPSALLSYVLKLNTSHIRAITDKLDKQAYDLVPGPKLVGFFMPNTADMLAYESVALKYAPAVPFYVITDRLVAKHLKLSIVGQINLVKPAEKVAITCPINPATALDIEAFIEANKGVVLKYLSEHNIFDPELQNPNKTTLIAIGDRTSAVGKYFHKLLTKTVRNITRENNITLTNMANIAAQAVAEPIVDNTVEEIVEESVDPNVDSTVEAIVETPVQTIVDLNAIEILWIDPQIFPSINVWMDKIQSHYGLAAGLDVYFGVVNTRNNQTVWFDTNLVNRVGDKVALESNMQLLKSWITSVINNLTVSTTTDSPTVITEQLVQQFAKEPQSIAVTENQEFVLECEVSGQVGDCLWLKDGQNIGFNLARISPSYKWRKNDGLGDCSLVVSAAVADRDDGEWVCEVTGDQTNPTITSLPAIVSVKSTPKTEL